MIVKVIIKRKVIKGKEKDFFPLLLKLRSEAMTQEGYIAGETLIDPEDPNKVVIISKWESLDDWNKWKANIGREKIDALLNELQEEQAEYEPYIFGKYRVAAVLGFPVNLQTKSPAEEKAKE